MPPWWFLAFVAVSFCVVLRNFLRQLRGDGIYIFGQRQGDGFVVFCLIGLSVLFLIIFGIYAAIGLGFITDYAPK